MIFIPITTASVVFCGRFITATIKYFIITFESRVLQRKKVTKFERKIIATQVVLNIKFILLLSLFYHRTTLRHLTFFDSFYFAFITLSTIGFGDIKYHFGEYAQYTTVEQTTSDLVLFVLFYTSFSLLASIIGSCVSLGTDSSYKKFKIIEVVNSRGKTIKVLCQNMVQMKPEDYTRALKSHRGSEDFVRAIKTEAESGWNNNGMVEECN